jgi:hypothetical protein
MLEWLMEFPKARLRRQSLHELRGKRRIDFLLWTVSLSVELERLRFKTGHVNWFPGK